MSATSDEGATAPAAPRTVVSHAGDTVAVIRSSSGTDCACSGSPASATATAMTHHVFIGMENVQPPRRFGKRCSPETAPFPAWGIIMGGENPGPSDLPSPTPGNL